MFIKDCLLRTLTTSIPFTTRRNACYPGSDCCYEKMGLPPLWYSLWHVYLFPSLSRMLGKRTSYSLPLRERNSNARLLRKSERELSLSPGQAPGPDGFSLYFYQHYLDIVRESDSWLETWVFPYCHCIVNKAAGLKGEKRIS
jgi:hypothetical protein